VYKDIRTIITTDKSKSLGVVEPLHGTPETRHLRFPRALTIGGDADGLNRRNLAEFRFRWCAAELLGAILLLPSVQDCLPIH
jgi:hypothetical protein